MRRALVCAAIVLSSAAALAQAPPPPPDQPAAPAPPKKKKKKKRPKLVTETEVYGRPKKGARPGAPAPPSAEPAPPPAGLLAPVPATPAPAPPAPEPPPPPAEEAVVVPTLSSSPAAQEDKAEKRFDATASVPPPDEPPQTFTLRAEPAWGYRRFLDTEASSTDKRSGTPGVFIVGGRAELYPFTGAQAGFMRDFGLTGSYFRAVALQLTDFDKNESVDAVWYGYSAGLRARLLGRRSPFALALTAGYEGWVFDFDTAVAPIRLIPKARYSLVAGGFDVRETFGFFSMFLEATYLLPLNIADLGDRLPMKGAYGGRGTFGVAFRLAKNFEIDAHATYTVMRFSLAPVPGRADEPGRVFDQYLVSALGLRLNL